MDRFSTHFHKLWDERFADTAIGHIKPIVGSRRLENLQEYLVRKKPDKSRLKIHSTRSRPTMALNMDPVPNESDEQMATRRLNDEPTTLGRNGERACAGIIHFHPTREAS